jgi:hypothetical protein
MENCFPVAIAPPENPSALARLAGGERSWSIAFVLKWKFNQELSGGRPVAKNKFMISNERPSPYGRRPYHGQSFQAPPRPFVQEDTIKTAEFQVERKFITVTLKENPRGRFLRITEDGGSKRNTVIIPITGLDDFKRVINEMAQAAEAMPAPKPVDEEEPGDSIGNR